MTESRAQLIVGLRADVASLQAELRATKDENVKLKLTLTRINQSLRLAGADVAADQLVGHVIAPDPSPPPPLPPPVADTQYSLHPIRLDAWERRYGRTNEWAAHIDLRRSVTASFWLVDACDTNRVLRDEDVTGSSSIPLLFRLRFVFDDDGTDVLLSNFRHPPALLFKPSMTNVQQRMNNGEVSFKSTIQVLSSNTLPLPHRKFRFVCECDTPGFEHLRVEMPAFYSVARLGPPTE